MTESIERWFLAALRTEHRGVVLAVVGLNLALTLFTGFVTLRDFPRSQDEYSYLIGAQLFSEGRLSVPSPEPRRFFDFTHVINDGRYYSRYPPGWPLLLSLGVLVSAPWLVNPLLGILTLMLIHRLALENFSREVANAALYAAAANPFLIFNSASYYSHTSCLLFTTLFAYAALRCLREPAVRLPYLVMGASLGAAFLIRPYTAVAVALPFGLWLLGKGLRAHRLAPLLQGLLFGAVPFTAFFIAFLVYNELQTGHPLLQPFTKYDPDDRPFHFIRSWYQVLSANVYTPLSELNRWIPLSALFLAAFVMSREARRDTRAMPLLAGFLSLFVAYFFFHTGPGARYGPRYLYEASFAVFILIGWVIVAWRRYALPALLVIAFLNLDLLVTSSAFHAAEVRDRMRVYDLVKEQQISNAIVFLRTRSGSAGQRTLTRNGIHFDGPVLYVRDLGERNSELLRVFPHRQAYVYEEGHRIGKGRLVPYER